MGSPGPPFLLPGCHRTGEVHTLQPSPTDQYGTAPRFGARPVLKTLLCLTSYIIMGKLTSLSKSQFPHLLSHDNHGT